MDATTRPRPDVPEGWHLTPELIEALDIKLDAQVIYLLKRAFDNVPAVSLPGSGMGGRAETPLQVITAILSMGATLSSYMQDNEELREQIRRHNMDLAAVRRVLGTLGQAEHEERHP